MMLRPMFSGVLCMYPWSNGGETRPTGEKTAKKRRKKKIKKHPFRNAPKTPYPRRRSLLICPSRLSIEQQGHARTIFFIHRKRFRAQEILVREERERDGRARTNPHISLQFLLFSLRAVSKFQHSNLRDPSNGTLSNFPRRALAAYIFFFNTRSLASLCLPRNDTYTYTYTPLHER